jgi:hypothetical protein
MTLSKFSSKSCPLASVELMIATRVHFWLRKYVAIPAAIASLPTPALNINEPGAGWTPGEKHDTIGPDAISGASALHWAERRRDVLADQLVQQLHGGGRRRGRVLQRDVHHLAANPALRVDESGDQLHRLQRLFSNEGGGAGNGKDGREFDRFIRCRGWTDAGGDECRQQCDSHEPATIGGTLHAHSTRVGPRASRAPP